QKTTKTVIASYKIVAYQYQNIRCFRSKKEQKKEPLE
ncbi:MAG: hypothetical protein ACJAR4_000257, partial [Psychroserpens sp.]